MAVLAQPISLGDVNDLEAFVHATINRSRRRHEPDERDELLSEGMRISFELWSRYDPHRAGYEREGRFSGFLAKFLPLKLEDAYHRMHPEHQLRTDPETGRRTYDYGERAVSLEAITGEDPDHQPLLADSDRGMDPATIKRLAHQAMFERWTARVQLWSEMAELLAHGATDADIAEVMGLTSEQVKQGKAAIAEVHASIFGGDA